MKKHLAALALAALLPACASAADLDYRYLDVAFSRGYSNFGTDTTFGPPVVGGQGYLLDGSFGIGEHWFVEASYRRNRFHQEFRSAPVVVVTPKSLRVGGGFHWAISDRADFVTHLDLGKARTDTEVVDFPVASQHEDDHGYVAGVGLRVRATDSLEMDLGLDHDNLGFGEQFVTDCRFGACFLLLQDRQEGAENVVSTALRYRFGMWGAGLEYRSSSFQDWRELLLSVRVNF